MRVVSLLPSATETVYALGIEPVGVSHECDYPPGARTRPRMNRVRIDPRAAAEEINDQVVEAQRQHGSVYEIDVDQLHTADPDLVLTQGVCDVCAVDSVLVKDAVEHIDLEPDILTLDPHRLGDILADIERIGDATDRPATAAALLESLEDRLDEVTDRTNAVERRPTVAVIDWMEPLMVAGHWVPDVVERAGGRPVLGESGRRSRIHEWHELLEADPEVIVIAPCGFHLAQTRENLDRLTDRPNWDELTAVAEGRVVAVDGHHYLNRPGPRIVETVQHLAGVLHPDRFPTPPSSAVRSVEDLAATA